MTSADDLVSINLLENIDDWSTNKMEITYVGVPLAVAGGLPLLYGFMKSMWIWFKLSRSVPWELRPYFTLIPDPVSGTVVAVAQKLQLSDTGLWRSTDNSVVGRKNHLRFHRNTSRIICFFRACWTYIASKLLRNKGNIHGCISALEKRLLPEYLGQCSIIRPSGMLIHPPSGMLLVPQSKLHMVKNVGAQFKNMQIVDDSMFRIYLTAVGNQPDCTLKAEFMRPYGGHAIMSRDSSGLLQTHRGCILPPEKLYRPWMNIALGFDLDIHPIPPEHEESGPVRCTVNIDWQTLMPPLAMTYAQFVWLALGMGVQMDFLADLSSGDRFETNGSCILTVSRTGNIWTVKGHRWFTTCKFSLRKALASAGIMLLEERGNLYLLPRKKEFSPDYGYQKSPEPLSSLSRIESLSYLIANERWNPRYPDPDQRTESAFTWALYYYHYGTDDTFNVEQNVSWDCVQLKYRSLLFLEKVDLKTALREALQQDQQNLVEELCSIIHDIKETSRELAANRAMKEDLGIVQKNLEELRGYDCKALTEWYSHDKRNELVRRLGWLASPVKYVCGQHAGWCMRKTNCISRSRRRLPGNQRRPEARPWIPAPPEVTATELRAKMKALRPKIYSIMERDQQGSELLKEFLPLSRLGEDKEARNSLRDLNDPTSIQAILAHLFVVLSFWEEPNTRRRWNGEYFKSWHGPVPKIGHEGVQCAEKAERVLNVFLGLLQVDDLFTCNPPKIEPGQWRTVKNSLSEDDIQRIVNGILPCLDTVIDHGLSVLKTYLIFLQHDIYDDFTGEFRTILEKHARTSVELA